MLPNPERSTTGVGTAKHPFQEVGVHFLFHLLVSKSLINTGGVIFRDSYTSIVAKDCQVFEKVMPKRIVQLKALDWKNDRKFGIKIRSNLPPASAAVAAAAGTSAVAAVVFVTACSCGIHVPSMA